MDSYNLQLLPSSGGGAAYSSSSSPSTVSTPPEIDTLLSSAGYHIRTSDLHSVAHRLESLDTAMINAPFDFSGDDLVLYNPSDLSSWLESLSPAPAPGPTNYPDATWTAQISPQPLAVAADVEEDSGIRLVHMLVTCAESVQRGDLPLAAALLDETKPLLKAVNSTRGIGKVAAHFIDALYKRLYTTRAVTCDGLEHVILYHHFYEASPYLKFAHFTANQAILEAFNGHDRVHVIDFSLMHGLQWPPLIQALALRPGGPPSLTLTGIGPHSLNEVGLKLAHLARSVNVRFTFNGLESTRLDDVDPSLLHVDPNETIAVNSILQLHKTIGPGSGRVLKWVKSLNPKIFTIVEQEANHNGPEFLDRFTEALHYYSTMFDSLEACQIQPEKALAEVYIQREICNVLSCEGQDRVERHEPLINWRARLGRAGFRPLRLGSNAFKQASMLLKLFSAEGYCVEEIDGCMTLGWHSRALIAASAWQVGIIDSN